MSSAETVSLLKPATIALAAQLKKKIKVNKEGIPEMPEDLYESTLADASLDLSTVKKVQQHNTDIAAALTLAVGESALEAMKKHAKLDQVNAEMKAGRDEISIIMHRSRDVNDMKHPGEKITQHGACSIKYTAKGINSAEIRKVRTDLMRQAVDILGS